MVGLSVNSKSVHNSGEKIEPARLLVTLSQLSREAAQTENTDHLLHNISKRLTSLMDVTGTSIVEWNQNSGVATVIAEHLLSRIPHPVQSDLGLTYQLRLDFPTTHAWLKAEQPQPRIENLASERSSTSFAFRKSEANSVLTVPIMIGEQVNAFIEFRAAHHDRVFGDDDVLIARMVAQHVAPLIRSHQMQQELKAANAELSRSRKVKDQIIQNVSHEFRTPLTVIQGYTELMLEDFAEDNVNLAEWGANLDIINTQLKRLTQQVETLVSFDHSSRKSLTREFVSLPNLLAKLAHHVQQMDHAHYIELEVCLDEPVPPVWADEAAVEQVMSQLLSNAIKFTPDGGKVSVTVHHNPHAKFVSVSVTDTGIGIEPDHIDHIFDQFYQVDGSLSRQFEGLGVGLALCRQIVEFHDGHIWAQSKPGTGSTFTFTLPTKASRK